MSTQVQHRRGTTVQHENFTGAMSEITHDTTGNNLRVHDGEKAGGYRTLMDQELGVANGIATLDVSGNVPEAQLGNVPKSYDYASAITLSESNVPAAITHVRTAGFADAGDGGDALYSRVATEPNHAGWVRSADGGIFSITKRTIRASQFGALPGLDDLHLRIADAVNYLNEIGGGELQIDHNDEYVLSGRILPNILTSDILITNPALGVLKAGVGQAVPILDLRASNTPGAVTNRILRLHDLRYDCSQGSTPSEGQYCTALNTQYFQQVIEDGTYAYGGVFGNNNSDSGHTPTANVYTKITNGRFIGFGDNGVYATGDNTTGSGGDGYSCEIINCDFEECNGAGQGKRELTLFKIHGGTVKRCASGFGSSEVYPTEPARNMIIENVFFDQVTANIAQFRGPTKGGMWDCYIRDWGRTIGTNESVGANAFAIVVRGASRLNFSGNHFTRVNWALDDQRAYNFENLTMFPGQAEETTYVQGEHHVEGNHYGGISRVYVEGAGGNPSMFLEETMRNIPANQIWNSTFNNNHVLTYMKLGSARRYTFQGGLEYVRSNLPDLVKNYSVNTTLIADDSGCLVTNQAQGAKRTFTLPTAVAGLSFKFMNMDAAGMRVQANSGDVVRINGSQSASAGYADSSTALGVSIELVAVDSTNWVAKSYTGTWTLG